MPDRNRRFILRERPSGRIGPDTFELREEAVPDIGDGEALVRVDWISLDPTNRAWINETPTYLPPVGIGEVMRAGGLGEVVASNNPNYTVGQTVQGLVGWQEYAVASDAMPLLPVDVAEGVSPSAYLGALGMTGLTAWIGIRDIGKPQPGETVVVSAAAGAVGSVAGQLAKSDGARVVGIAGGAEKCALLTDRLGFDAAVDHRAEDWAAQLAAATPNGIDVDFENVGGDIMDAIRAPQHRRARRAVRPDLRLQLGRPAARTARVREPAHPARDAAGLHRPRPLRPRGGGDRRDRRPDRRGQAHATRDRRRGLRAAADGDQYAVRRQERRQARRQDFRLAARAGITPRRRRGGPPPRRRAIQWYRTHGRLHSGDAVTMAHDAVTAYTADVTTGRDALLVCDTTEMCDALNRRIHHATVHADAPTVTAARGQRIAVGDLIISRRNDSTMRIYEAQRDLPVADPVRNGNRWRVAAVDADRNRIAARRLGDGARATFDGDYVREHITHGYAVTVHTAQGVTADTSHVVLGENTTRAALYVAMTRGREANNAYLYERPTEASEYSDAGADGPHVLCRGSSRAAARLFGQIIATDARARTAHDLAAATGRERLPMRVAALLIDRRADTLQARRAVYHRCCSTAQERSASHEQSTDQHRHQSLDDALEL